MRIRIPSYLIALVCLTSCLAGCSDDSNTSNPTGVDAGDVDDMSIEDTGGSDAAVDVGMDTRPDATQDMGTDAGQCDTPCGEECCADGMFCNFGSCEQPGDFCQRDQDCSDTDYCELTSPVDVGTPPSGGLTCSPLGELPWGVCVARPNGLEACTHAPDAGFEAVVEYAWGETSSMSERVMMTPVVVQLDDERCDAIPEIVFLSFSGNDYNNLGGNSARLVAITATDGSVTERLVTSEPNDNPTASIAAGNIDGVPGNEIVVCNGVNRVRAYNSTGTTLWLSESFTAPCRTLALADVDQDGNVEVIAGDAILDGVSGMRETTLPRVLSDVAVTDIDGDGDLDVVGPSGAYDSTGFTIADTGLPGASLAVAQLDGAGLPEVISVYPPDHSMSIWRVNPAATGGAEVIRTLDLHLGSASNCCLINSNSPGCQGGGGAPTVADFNGDGVADVGVATGAQYRVFDGAKLMDSTVADVDTMVWELPVQDCSSAQTGSSSFDLDGDGRYEVLFSDETTFRVLNGMDGSVLFETCNTSGTIRELPVVADVDGDGFAEIVVPSNNYSGLNCDGTKTTGVRVFGAKNGHWARAPRIWNQASFHVTNVESEGTVPASPANHWMDSETNIFRATTLGAARDMAPDLVAELSVRCEPDLTIAVRVRNVGEASAPGGVQVDLYDGDPSNGVRIGSVTTSGELGVLGSTVLELTPAVAPTGPIFAVIDDGATHAWQECRTDNNTAGPLAVTCPP